MRPTPERLAAARLALDGVSLGDAFGQVFLFQPEPAPPRLERRSLPPGPWRWSDDTMMALSILEVLEEHGGIEQDRLAEKFARRFVEEPQRGYGAVAHHLLSRMGAGEPWRQVVRSVYDGQGSMGNGGAMRVAPVGAYFAGEPEAAAREARASAEVTHAHPEGQAGAIAVAVAAARIRQGQQRHQPPSFGELLDEVLAYTPEGATREGVRRARGLEGTPFARASEVLGDGSHVLSSDTVPYALFCAASRLGSFEDALFGAMEGLLDPAADRDTVCAIVGGLVALSVGVEGLPATWHVAREPLP
jgi:ADP-ribosylglycohydrolase